MEKSEKEVNLPDSVEDTLDDENTVYELGFHLLPSLSEEELNSNFAEIKTLIENHGGTLVAEEAPKAMKLAYTMVKKQEGKNIKFDSSFFGWVKFEMTADQVVLLKKEIDLEKSVLRFIIIKTVKESTMFQPKPVFRTAEVEAKPIENKPEIEDVKKDATPISDEELDKTIEDLVS